MSRVEHDHVAGSCPPAAPDEKGRIVVLAAIALAAGVGTWRLHPRLPTSDLGFMQAAAREFLRGGNPYAVVGPTGSYFNLFHLRYPLTAVMAATPFAPWSLRLADSLWAALSFLFLGLALTKDRLWPPSLTVFTSLAFFTVLRTSQWSAFLTAAALFPAFGLFLAVKPTIGAALWVAYPNRKALIGAALFVVVATLIRPSWIGEWRQSLGSLRNMVPAVLEPGGLAVLAALFEWRTPEGRLLVALACVPQTHVLYDTLPLFLTVRTWAQGLCLSAGTWLVMIMMGRGGPYNTYESWMAASGKWTTWFVYLPCTAIVLWPRVTGLFGRKPRDAASAGVR
jgi:hypothetical protein